MIPSIKLALIPSVYKVGKLYSVIPTDGSCDFVVSRNSLATRINKNGNFESINNNIPRFQYNADTGAFRGILVEDNTVTQLFLDNILFTTALGAGLSQVSTSFLLGSSAVSRLLSCNVAGVARTNVIFNIKQSGNPVINGTTYTSSVYVKKGNSSLLSIVFTSLGNGLVVNLDNNSTVNGSTIISSLVEDIGQGWKKISYTAVATATSLVNLRMSTVDSLGEFATSVIGEFNCAAPMIVAGSAPTSYIPTGATSVVRQADIINVTVPVGVTQILERVNGINNTITVIPTTYQVPNGIVERVIMR
jgi:hypothetical protein